MRRQLLLLGLVGGCLITALQWTEYRFLVVEHSVEVYGALIAMVFAALGIWLGLRMTARRSGDASAAPPSAVAEAAAPMRSESNAGGTPGLGAGERKRADLGLTPRELEILELVAEGLSNREIGERLFVSENTVKTHCSRAFDKLGAKRRTQAVQLGKEYGLLR